MLLAVLLVGVIAVPHALAMQSPSGPTLSEHTLSGRPLSGQALVPQHSSARPFGTHHEGGGAVTLAVTYAVTLAVSVARSVDAVAVLAVNDLPTIVSNLRNWVMGILAALATLFLTIGGVRYLMAGGDPAEVERAKGAFRSAVVGYALAVIAPVVLTVLQSIIGG